MNITRFFSLRLIIILCTFALSVSSCSMMFAQDFSIEWDAINRELDSGKTQSARTLLYDVLQKSMQAKKSPALIKTIIHIAALSGSGKEPNDRLIIKTIHHYRDSVSKPEEKALLSLILAEALWNYLQYNTDDIRNRPYNNIEIQSLLPLASIDDWNEENFIQAIDVSIQQSLSYQEVLLGIPARNFQDILRISEGSNVFRPTLFDIIAFRVISLWEKIEQREIRTDKAELSDNAALAPARMFQEIKLDTLRGSALYKSPLLHIITLYKRILQIHAKDVDLTAYVDADIQRLLAISSRINHDDKDSVLIESLIALGKSKPSTIANANALVEAALLLNNRENNIRVISLCKQVELEFPNTQAAERCKQLTKRILQQSLKLSIQESLLPNTPFIFRTEYGNIERIYCKIIPVNDSIINAVSSRRYRDLYIDNNAIEQLGALQPLKAWKQELPKVEDYAIHSTWKKGPPLPKGEYVFLLSNSPVFDLKGNNAVAYAHIRVSSLACYTQKEQSGDVRIFLTDAFTGKPRKGTIAIIDNIYDKDNAIYSNKESESFLTDDNGMALANSVNDERYIAERSLRIVSGQDTIRINHGLQRYSNEFRDTTQKLHLITDRSLYRPGQTIHFKGILYKKEDFATAYVQSKKTIAVQFYDARSRMIDSSAYSTGDFGSFEGSFFIPSTALPGYCSLITPFGSTSIHITEYKRPTFEVILKQENEKILIGKPVTVSGSAKTYSGAQIGNANVTYRVFRSTVYPCWYQYWLPKPQSKNRDIAHGTVKTRADGTFTILFEAIPESGFRIHDAPVFSYQVKVDITGPNGETQSTELTVQAGVLAAQYTFMHDPIFSSQEKPNINLQATSSEGKPAKFMKGIITLELLKSPNVPYLSLPFEPQDQQGLSKQDMQQLFPHEIVNHEDIMMQWETLSTIVTKEYSTDSLGNINPDISVLKPGGYRITYTSKSEQIPFSISSTFSVFDNASTQMPYKATSILHTKQSTLHPGEKAILYIGSSWAQSTILVQIESQGNIVDQFHINRNNDFSAISIPVKDSYRGGFTVHCTMVRLGRLITQSIRFTVPWNDKVLAIHAATFRNRTLPGSKEQWTFTVKPESILQTPEIECAAIVYDASLDAIIPQKSLSLFGLWEEYYSSAPINGETFNQANTSLISGKSWNDNNDALSILQEYDDINLDILLGGIYGRTEVVFFDDFLSSRGLSTDKAIPMASMMKAQVQSTEEKTTSTTSLSQQKKQEYSLRKVQKETALFAPFLYPNRNGELSVSLTMPDDLTRWNTRIFAHSKDMKTGFLDTTITTSKPFMISGNTPRFLRSGDTVSMQAAVFSLNAEQSVQGKATMKIFTVDSTVPIIEKVVDFSVDQHHPATTLWTFVVPDIQSLTMQISAQSQYFSDGEAYIIPVLSSKVTVSDNIPIWLNSTNNNTSQTISLPAVTDSVLSCFIQSSTAPQWYALENLPDLMKASYGATTDYLYALMSALLAQQFLSEHADIAAIIKSKSIQGRLTQSRMFNSDEQSPWSSDIEDEANRDSHIDVYANPETLQAIAQHAFEYLQTIQYANGGFPWFNTMNENRFITQSVLAILGKMHAKKIPFIQSRDCLYLIKRTINYLDEIFVRDFNEYVRYLDKNDTVRLSTEDIHYLYARSFFFDSYPLVHNSLFDTLVHALWQNRLYHDVHTEAMTALIFSRLSDNDKAKAMLRSLKERAILDNTGMHWLSKGWHWKDAPVETHSMILDAFQEISPETEILNGILQYILRQKQVQHWKTSSATISACMSLLTWSQSCLVQSKPLFIMVNQKPLIQEPESFPGQFTSSIPLNEAKKALNVTIQSEEECPAWGGVFRTYKTELKTIQHSDSLPLSIHKELFIKSLVNGKEQVIRPLLPNEAYKIGDNIIIRLTVQSQTMMDYVHIKDLRPAGFEYMDQIAGYRHNNRGGYYAIPRDASMNFFVEYLAKGKNVFEYEVRADRAGSFSAGISTVQSYYAPEFGSKTGGGMVKIKENAQ